MGRPDKLLLAVFLMVLAGAAVAELPSDVRRALASRDYATAVVWLEEQAYGGDGEAAFELGKLYRLGRGVPEDPARAGALFQQAALAGHVEAMFLLGRHHEREGDPLAAHRWMARAAAEGHGSAQTWLERQPPPAAFDLFDAIRSGRAPEPGEQTTGTESRDASGRTPLILAAELGSLPWLDLLLRQGADPDSRDEAGTTALIAAAAGRHWSAVRRLLAAGADPALRAGAGNTALHLAVSAGAVGTVRDLLTAGASPTAADHAGWSPRMLARRGDSEEIRRLLGVAPTPAHALLAEDREALLAVARDAARRGKPQLLQEVLNRPEVAGTDLVRLEPALREAARQGEAQVLDVLLGAGVGQDIHLGEVLPEAVRAGCLDCVKLFVRRGAGLELRDSQGRTPLILAARQGAAAVVRFLLNAGASPESVDDSGRNALWWAAREGNSETALLLLESGVLPEADTDGVGPLHLAAGNDDARLVAALLPLASPEGASRDGSRPLHVAAHHGAPAALLELLAAGAEVDAANAAGDTALMVAVRAGYPGCARQLLEAGASMIRRNTRFESAASLMAGRPEVVWRSLLESSDAGLLGILQTGAL